MAIAFLTANSKLPGLNWETGPGPRDLEYLLDTVFADEQRQRLQLAMAMYRVAGPAYGVVDEANPRSASAGSGRPLVVQPNAGNPLSIDILPGIAVTKAGNIIVISESLFGILLATTAQDTPNVVLLE